MTANSMGVLKNSRWESFARHVASGMSQTEAWRSDRPRSHASAKSIHEKASKLAARPEVAARIRELAQEAASSAVATSRELQEFLTRIIRTPVGRLNVMSDLVQDVERNGHVRRVRMPSKIDAIDRLARMLGYYVPEKSEQTVRVAGVESMTDAELEAITRGDA